MLDNMHLWEQSNKSTQEDNLRNWQTDKQRINKYFSKQMPKKNIVYGTGCDENAAIKPEVGFKSLFIYIL